jgi:hypothetical protein
MNSLFPVSLLQKQKSFKAWQGFVGVLGALIGLLPELMPHLAVLVGEERARKWGAALFLISIVWRTMMDAKDSNTLKEINKQNEGGGTP